MSRPSVDDMLSLAGHEVRTPLAVIRGYAELLSRSSDEAPAAASTAIVAAVERLETACEVLLSAFALATVGSTRRAVPTSLEVVASEAAARLSRLETATPAIGEPRVTTDPELLTSAATSLLAAASAVDPDASVELVEEHGCAGLSISGSPAWTQSGPAKLALFLARRLVERDGGAVELRPGEERSAALVLLPAGSGEPLSGIPRILVVDDDASVRSLLRATLPVDDGYEIAEARDGVEALRAVEESPPDLILLDWSMPGMSGAEVLEQLRAAGSSAPVVMLTAESAAEQRDQAAALGARGFLTKPFSPLELLSVIEHILVRPS